MASARGDEGLGANGAGGGITTRGDGRPPCGDVEYRGRGGQFGTSFFSLSSSAVDDSDSDEGHGGESHDHGASQLSFASDLPPPSSAFRRNHNKAKKEKESPPQQRKRPRIILPGASLALTIPSSSGSSSAIKTQSVDAAVPARRKVATGHPNTGTAGHPFGTNKSTIMTTTQASAGRGAPTSKKRVVVGASSHMTTKEGNQRPRDGTTMSFGAAAAALTTTKGVRPDSITATNRHPSAGSSSPASSATSTSTYTASSTSADAKQGEDDDDSDMEIPYTQNLGIDSATGGGGGPAPRRKKLNSSGGPGDLQRGREPLNPGDVIMYTHPLFVVGAGGGKGRVPRGLRVAQVWSIHPQPSHPKADDDDDDDDDDDYDDDYFPLELSNGELLPNDHMVQRLKEYRKGQLRHHRGVYRPIDHFRLRPSSLPREVQAQFLAQLGQEHGTDTKADRLMSVLDSFRDEAFRALNSSSPLPANSPPSKMADASSSASDSDDDDDDDDSDDDDDKSGPTKTTKASNTAERGSPKSTDREPPPAQIRPKTTRLDSDDSSSSASSKARPAAKADAKRPAHRRPSSSSSSSSDDESVTSKVERPRGTQGSRTHLRAASTSEKIPMAGTSKSTKPAANPANPVRPTDSHDSPATTTGLPKLTKWNVKSRSQPSQPKPASTAASASRLEAGEIDRPSVRFEGVEGLTRTAVALGSPLDDADDEDDDSIPPSSGLSCSPGRRSSTSDSSRTTPTTSTNALAKATSVAAAAATTHPSARKGIRSPKTAQSTSSSSLGGGPRGSHRKAVPLDDLFDYDTDDDVLEPPKKLVAKKLPPANPNLAKTKKRLTQTKRPRSCLEDLDKSSKRRKAPGSVSSVASSNRSYQSVFRPSCIEKTKTSRAGTSKSGSILSIWEDSSDDEGEDRNSGRQAFLKPPPPSGNASVASTVQSFGSQRRGAASGSSASRGDGDGGPAKATASTHKSPHNSKSTSRIAPSASSSSARPASVGMQLSFQRVPRSSILDF